MKKVLFSLLLISSSVFGYDSIGLGGFPGLLLGQNPDLFWSVAPTMSWYKIRRSTVVDTGNDQNKLQNDSGKVVPGFCVTFGRRWKEVEFGKRQQSFKLQYGLKIAYSRRKAAVTTDLFEPDFNTISFSVKQDVSDGRFSPYLALLKEFDQKQYLGLSVGFGIGTKLLDHFKVYEKATASYTGQRLSSGSLCFLAEFGAFAGARLKDYDDYFIQLGYQFSMGTVRYRRRLYIDDADSAASQRFQDQALLVDRYQIALPKGPHIKVRCHHLSFSVGRDF